jgi:hypothetical protein
MAREDLAAARRLFRRFDVVRAADLHGLDVDVAVAILFAAGAGREDEVFVGHPAAAWKRQRQGPRAGFCLETDLKRRREKFFQIGRIERGDTAKARVVYSGALSL